MAAPVVIGEFGWMGDDVFGFTVYVNAFPSDWPAGLELTGVSVSLDGVDAFASYVASGDGSACVGQGATVGATTTLQFPGVNPAPSSGCTPLDPPPPFEEARLAFALNDVSLGVLTVAALDGPLRLPGEFLAAVPLLFEAATPPPPPTPVPEPGVLALLGAGLVLLRCRRQIRAPRSGATSRGRRTETT
jgi:MYXO-CTERM domain-containing protein